MKFSGTTELRMLKQAYSGGRVRLPQALADAPTLSLGLELYYHAYLELHTTRSWAFGPGPIPWSAVRDYAEAHRFDVEQTEDLLYYVSKMDEAYIKYASEKAKS